MSLGRRVDRAVFGWATGPCHPAPFAVFRVCFYVGLLVHLGPSIAAWDANFGADAFRIMEWDTWVHREASAWPQPALKALAGLTLTGILLGILGVFPRVAVALGCGGMYFFASLNALNLQTLALASAWAVGLILLFAGGGDEALSLAAWWRRRTGRPAKRARRIGRALVAWHLAMGFVFAGMEKLGKGWPGTNEMHLLFSYPRGFVVRDWVSGSPLALSETAGYVFSVSTIAVELVVPLLWLFRPTRVWAALAYQGFFVGIIVTLEVPALFYFLFAAGGLMVIDDHHWARIFGPDPARRSDESSHGDGPAGAS